jgi:apoptosis-inducing factor 3
MAKSNSEEGDLNLNAGVPLSRLEEGKPLGGNVGDDKVVVVKRGEQIFAIGARCTHYSGPLEKGLVVGTTIRCPWHHAVFDLETSRAVGAPAFKPTGCYPVEVEGDKFRVLPKQDPPVVETPRQEPKSVTIVGAGAAAAAATEMLRQQGYEGPITMIGHETSGPVDRPNLSKDYLAGEAQPDWIPLGGDEHWRDLGVELITGEEVVEIDGDNKRVRTRGGESYDYDVLLYATGAEPIVPPIEGIESAKCFTLRSFDDSRTIAEAADENDQALVVGASFIGLEVAASLRNRGVDVTVVAPEKLPLAKAFGDELGKLVKTLHEDQGVTFHLEQTVDRFDEDRAYLSGGDEISFDFVVMGTGVKPRTDLAEKAGLEVDDGVVIDGKMRTSDPSIYAAGDVARYPDPTGNGTARIEHWVLAERLAQRAARNMVGAEHLGLTDIPFFWSWHYDLKINYVGHATDFDEVVIDGSVPDRDATIGYLKGGRVLAVATLGRALASLRAEQALADDDQQALRQMLNC